MEKLTHGAENTNNMESEKTQNDFYETRKKETLSAVDIKNRVLWISSGFEKMPIKVEGGKSSEAGLFLTPKPNKEDKKNIKVIIMPEKISGRSLLLDSVFFKDKEGRLYRDIDAKGIGCFLKTPSGKYVVGEIKKRSLDQKQAKGLLDYREAKEDQEYTEFFINKGIRTHRVLAILDLEELVDARGKKISISEAKEKEMISEEMHPVISLRAFGTKERLEYININDKLNKHRSILALQDAVSLVAIEENKKPEDFSLKDYILWFAKTLGGQVAKIRKLGAYHGHLHQQNITLDCHITDFEGVLSVDKIPSTITHNDRLKAFLNEENLSPEIIYESEYEAGKESFNNFLLNILKLTNNIKLEDIERALKVYEESYNKELVFS